jgi:alpha-glucosidase (family GH31 glycosyl hydrolase)
MRARSISSLVVSFGMLAFLSMVHAAIRVENTSSELSAKTGLYEIKVAHSGFQIEIRRGGELVLQSASATDPFPNLGFLSGGKQQHLTSLRSFRQSEDTVLLDYDTTLKGTSARIEMNLRKDRVCFRTWILSNDSTFAPSFRYRLSSSGYWYGGAFQGYRDPQAFPLNKAAIAPRLFFAQGASQGTPIWYSTKGVAIWVRTPHDFVYSINDVENGKPDGLLNVEMPGVSSLSYDVLIAPDVREVIRRINREIGWPKTVPPAEYFRLPIYTTWVEYKTGVSQQKVLEFAHAIRDNKLPAGVIEIDDKWENGYGDMRFDASKFPDPKAMNDELHRLGFRVTLWVHPFVNVESQSFNDAHIQPFLMKDLSGKPGLIKWWQGDAAVWDFTNPQAAAEFRTRLGILQEKYGFDGFKFDGGDVNLVPIDLAATKPISAAEFSDIYNREATAYFPWSETRVGVYSQPLGVVQRLIDKESVWGKDNGLAATIPEAIMTSMRGFDYVMPDMVGGNQYENDKTDRELLVRWAQASALMPLVQFSLGPWHFDEETLALCRAASELHVTFAPYIVKLANDAPKTGEPILRPIWYNYPADNAAQEITDEFMLGDVVLVAAVLEKGATARDIYLPEGQWRDYNTGKIIEGGRKLISYPAPLNILPVFIKVGGGSQLGLRD